MGEIPQRQRACLMGGGGHRFHVVHVAGAVVHMSQHQHGYIVGESAREFGRVFDQPQFMASAEQRRQTFRHIEIGRKIAAVRQNHATVGSHLQGGIQYLKHLDRQGVAHDD